MTYALIVRELRKAYATVQAVAGVSFEVARGEIFGLLGPNGAGKTTTIRIIMDILKPDAGQVTVLGTTPEAARERVGYLPEERGLYPNQRVMDVLVYLAELKGRSRGWARRRAEELLARVELSEWAKAKVRELSRGMQQKVQFIASIIHDPDLCIFDEPFQGLDPVNVQLVKEIMRELQAQGKTIVLSTHQMNQVEALCNRIALINQGRLVLYGDLGQIKREYSPNIVTVQTGAPLPSLEGVVHVRSRDSHHMLELASGVSPQAILEQLVAAHVPIQSFAVESLPLEDIFVRVVKGA